MKDLSGSFEQFLMQMVKIDATERVRSFPYRPSIARLGPKSDRSSRKMHFEALEPRILLSAGLNPVPNPVDPAITASAAAQQVLKQDLSTDPAPVIDMALADPALPPFGSLVHLGPVSGSFEGTPETDAYSVTTDRGQTLTIGILPSASIRPEMTVVDPLGHSTTLTATTAGQTLLLQNLQTGDGGTFSINFTNLEGTGSYDAAYWLNAEVEAENYGGPANNGTNTATDLDDSAVDLPSDGDRLAVVGLGTDTDADYYSFNLASDQIVTLALSPTQETAPPESFTLEMLDPDGNVIALGEDTYTNADETIRDFVAPVDGVYYARVSGGVEGGLEYSLLVTRGAGLGS